MTLDRLSMKCQTHAVAININGTKIYPATGRFNFLALHSAPIMTTIAIANCTAAVPMSPPAVLSFNAFLFSLPNDKRRRC